MENKLSLILNISPENAEEQAAYYDNCGADILYYPDQTSFETGKCDTKSVKAIRASSDIPLFVCGKVNRFEDIKKMIYAGSDVVLVREEDCGKAGDLKEAIGRFGSDRIFLMTGIGNPEETLERVRDVIRDPGFGGIVFDADVSVPDNARIVDYVKVHLDKPVYALVRSGDAQALLSAAKMSMADGLITVPDDRIDVMAVKQVLKSHSVPVNTFESAIDFDEFRLNSDKMIPCITQDYKTGEVLMLAYMTRESFEKTVETGKMTYYSRSRQELWTKGDTSGHYQYVKSLSIDCDKDTLLAKVAQIGAACHTGNRSCFYTNLLNKDVSAKNPLQVFEDVFDTIKDRKDHPKEGSYTNYLFDQGIDKILKKIGEESTEIVIAAKNPDSDELKYEICDFLYHMMVLMADRDISWKEITGELAQRH